MMTDDDFPLRAGSNAGTTKNFNFSILQLLIECHDKIWNLSTFTSSTFDSVRVKLKVSAVTLGFGHPRLK